MKDKLFKLVQSSKEPCDNGFCPYESNDVSPCCICEVESLVDHLIAHGVTVQKWIPVSERLPKESGYYLVHHKGGFVSERYFYEDAPEIFAQVRNDPVAHWMPLPAAPKEAE